MTLVQDTEADVVLKLLLIGDSGTGKSSLLDRFVNDSFVNENAATIGVDFQVKMMKVGGKNVKLSIWDTAGQERFRTVTASYYRGAHGVIFVYDVTRRETFNHIEQWLKELNNYTTSYEIVKMLVGNKIDRKDVEVERKEGERSAQDYAMLFIETSAKTSTGVEDAFEELVHKILETPSVLEGSSLTTGKPVKVVSTDDEYESCYC